MVFKRGNCSNVRTESSSRDISRERDVIFVEMGSISLRARLMLSGDCIISDADMPRVGWEGLGRDILTLVRVAVESERIHICSKDGTWQSIA